VLALGMLGSMNVNEALADMLHDEDPNVRQFAGDALWTIWFRADVRKTISNCSAWYVKAWKALTLPKFFASSKA